MSTKTITQQSTTFLQFVNRPDADNVNALKRADRFDEQFKNYELYDDGVIVVEKQNGDAVTFTPIELFARFQTPDALPNGNGKIDAALDGKTGEKRTSAKVKYLQSADDYLQSTIASNVDAAAIWNLINKLPKAPKVADYAKVVLAIRSTLLPAEKELVYMNMLDSERETDELKTLGFVFGQNAVTVAENRKQYKATISQEAITANGPVIKELIELVGSPKAVVNGDAFAGTLKTEFEVTFYLKNDGKSDDNA